MTWLFLALAIATEVCSTLALRLVSDGKKLFLPVIVGGYALAFVFITISLAHGMPLGVAYGVWVAAGVAITALLSRLLFGEPLNWLLGLGIALIGAGVLLIEMGGAH